MGTTAATGQPSACTITDLNSDLDTFNDANTSTQTNLTALHAAQAIRTETSDGQLPTKESLFEIEVTYKNGYYEEMLKSGVLERVDSGQCIIKDDTLAPASTTVGVINKGDPMPANYERGSDRTEDYPWMKRDGYRVYEVVKETAAVKTPADLTQADTDMGTAQGNYDTAVGLETTARGDYDAEVATCAIGLANIPPTAYLKDADPEDIEILTINDYTFVLNKNKTAAMKGTLSPAQPNEAFIVIQTVAYNANYKVTVNGTPVTHTTPQSVSGATLDSGTIAAAVAGLLNGQPNITATQIGPGIYVSSTSPFTISTEGSSQEEGIYVFQEKINVASRLPNQCENGYIVKSY